MIADAAGTITSGALPLAILVAVAAGFVSFASPCVLPLVPGFLGYVTGLSGVTLEQRSRGRLMLGALLFVLGFSVVFIAVAVTVSAAGTLLKEHQSLLMRLGGVIVILMALMFLGSGRLRRSCGPAGSRPPVWPERRCSEWCSAWGGRRAPGRRSARSWRCRPHCPATST